MTPETTPEHLPLPQSDPESTAPQCEVHEKRACFPSSTHVTIRDGTHIPMAHLRFGDLVESEPGHFSPAILNAHADLPANSTFVVVRTRRGSQMAASPGHYQLTRSGRLRLAREFRVHDELRTAFGMDHVVSMRSAIFRGLQNPQTASGKLMVTIGSERGAIQASTNTILYAFLITISIDLPATGLLEHKQTRMFPRAHCALTRLCWPRFTRRFLLTDTEDSTTK